MDERWRNLAAAGALSALLVGGCGGGGSDGGGQATLVYQGVSGRAAVDENNARDFGEPAIAGPSIGIGLRDLGSIDASAPRSAARLVAGEAFNLVRRVAARSAGLDVPVVKPGNCGGQVSGTIDLRNGSLLEFDATLRFERYCRDGTTVDGVIGISSRVQPNEDVQIVETFARLHIEDGTDSLLLGGTVKATGNLLDDSGTLTLNFVVEDALSGTQVWFDELVIDAAEDIATLSLSLFGRMYHSDHGFVELTTDLAGALALPYENLAAFVAPLVVPVGSDNPISGGVLFVGVGGTAAILHVLSETQYEIIVDDGDQVFDAASDPILGPFFWN